MMSQMEQRAQALQRKVQEFCEGQFELTGTTWGSNVELTEIMQGNTRIQNLGMIFLENSVGNLELVSSGTNISDAYRKTAMAKTLIIAGPARYLGIDRDGAGLKLFDLTGFDP